MHLHSQIVVPQSIEVVTGFFYAPSSLAKWDRSVKDMIPGEVLPNGAGATFETIAPSGMKMRYQVVEFNSANSVKIKLLESKMFRDAIWHFEFEKVGDGTRIVCHIYYSLKPLYWFLAPVLFLNKGALLRDLRFLSDAINEYEKSHNNSPVLQSL